MSPVWVATVATGVVVALTVGAAVGGQSLGARTLKSVRIGLPLSTLASGPLTACFRHRGGAPGAGIPMADGGSGHRGPADADLADMIRFLDTVARLLRSGHGVHTALRHATNVAGVHAGPLHNVVRELDGGIPLAGALASWRRRCPRPSVALAAGVLTFGLSSGGSMARGVDAAAATLRERLTLVSDVRVLAAQARASALVVAAAPVGFTIVVGLADPRIFNFLFTTPAGWVCIGVGAALETGCVVWMRSLVAAAGAG